MTGRRLLQTVLGSQSQLAGVRAPVARGVLARFFAADAPSDDSKASSETPSEPKKQDGERKADRARQPPKASASAADSGQPQQDGEKQKQQKNQGDKPFRRSDRPGDAFGKRAQKKQDAASSSTTTTTTTTATATPTVLNAGGADTSESLRTLLSTNTENGAQNEAAASSLKASDFSLKEGQRLGFFSSKPAAYKPTKEQIELQQKQDEWAKTLASKTAKIFAESELIEVGPFDSQRYAPVYEDPMAEIRRHTDFSKELSSFKGTRAQKYYLELVTLALAKNPSYSADQKHEVIRKTMMLMARAESEPLPPMDHLIGFPTPSAKELAKPVKSKK